MLLSSIKAFKTYLDQITSSLNLEQEEERELQEEWYQHLVDLMNDFIHKGVPKDESIQLAIQQFGEVPLLKSEINRNFLNPRRLHFMKELIIWFICLVATSIGPSLLIDAHYSIFFSIGTIVLLGICYVIYYFVLKGIKASYIKALGLLLLYASFIYLVVHENSFMYFISELFSFNLSGDGLFTISIIHLLWMIIIGKHLLTRSFDKQQLLNIIQSSFKYWSMIIIGLFIIVTELLTNSGEGKVIIGNVFLLYGFLEQVIDPKIFIRSNNVIKHWLKV